MTAVMQMVMVISKVEVQMLICLGAQHLQLAAGNLHTAAAALLLKLLLLLLLLLLLAPLLLPPPQQQQQ
jgi:hypothetical protein